MFVPGGSESESGERSSVSEIGGGRSSSSSTADAVTLSRQDCEKVLSKDSKFGDKRENAGMSDHLYSQSEKEADAVLGSMSDEEVVCEDHEAAGSFNDARHAEKKEGAGESATAATSNGVNESDFSEVSLSDALGQLDDLSKEMKQMKRKMMRGRRGKRSRSKPAMGKHGAKAHGKKSGAEDDTRNHGSREKSKQQVANESSILSAEEGIPADMRENVKIVGEELDSILSSIGNLKASKHLSHPSPVRSRRNRVDQKRLRRPRQAQKQLSGSAQRSKSQKSTFLPSEGTSRRSTKDKEVKGALSNVFPKTRRMLLDFSDGILDYLTSDASAANRMPRLTRRYLGHFLRQFGFDFTSGEVKNLWKSLIATAKEGERIAAERQNVGESVGEVSIHRNVFIRALRLATSRQDQTEDNRIPKTLPESTTSMNNRKTNPQRSSRGDAPRRGWGISGVDAETGKSAKEVRQREIVERRHRGMVKASQHRRAARLRIREEVARQRAVKEREHKLAEEQSTERLVRKAADAEVAKSARRQAALRLKRARAREKIAEEEKKAQSVESPDSVATIVARRKRVQHDGMAALGHIKIVKRLNKELRRKAEIEARQRDREENRKERRKQTREGPQAELLAERDNKNHRNMAAATRKRLARAAAIKKSLEDRRVGEEREKIRAYQGYRRAVEATLIDPSGKLHVPKSDFVHTPRRLRDASQPGPSPKSLQYAAKELGVPSLERVEVIHAHADRLDRLNHSTERGPYYEDEVSKESRNPSRIFAILGAPGTRSIQRSDSSSRPLLLGSKSSPDMYHSAFENGTMTAESLVAARSLVGEAKTAKAVRERRRREEEVKQQPIWKRDHIPMQPAESYMQSPKVRLKEEGPRWDEYKKTRNQSCERRADVKNHSAGRGQNYAALAEKKRKANRRKQDSCNVLQRAGSHVMNEASNADMYVRAPSAAGGKAEAEENLFGPPQVSYRII